MAEWFYLPGMRASGRACDPEILVALQGLRSGEFGDGWDRIPGLQAPFDGLVPRDVACDQPEERRQRIGLATRARAWVLPFGLADAAQTSEGDGEAWPGSPEGRGGG